MYLAQGVKLRDVKSHDGAEVVLGEDWVSSPASADREFRNSQARRGVMAVNSSPLARKIITFNLLGLIVLVAGVLYLNPFRDSLVYQHELGLVAEAELIADMIEIQFSEPQAALTGSESAAITASAGTFGAPGQSGQFANTLARLDLRDGIEVFIFNPDGVLLATTEGQARAPSLPVEGLDSNDRSTMITDMLNWVWEAISGLITPVDAPRAAIDQEENARALMARAMQGVTRVSSGQKPDGGTMFTVATPVMIGGSPAGVVAISSAAGALDELVRNEREQVLQMFVIAILVSIGLSLVLASTIANPISDLAAAAEIGREKDTRNVNPGRVRIPDLTGRPDEIGRLSTALRGMVSALYDRIDANEQFAADVAHEIKNPLASLRSAVGTLRVAKREDQRDKLLDVIDHDVRRLDRLVSDISNASRLDSELVKEDEQTFDLLKMMQNLTDYLGEEAGKKEIDFITDLPTEAIMIQGLEARLAQVFVNLITNATSFCEEGDAIRVWVRQRENRVLVVVEDTGPGIPEEALTKIFNRFYSERPENQFGNNSGLGLAISKQIVEAHGGVVWAENIRPTDADITSEPLGARFVVGLPV